MTASLKISVETKNSPEARQLSAALTDFVSKNADRLGYLWGRWQDEKEFEDW